MSNSGRVHEHAGDGRQESPVDEPSNPTQIEKRSWKYIVKRTGTSFFRDHCTDGAATLTYYTILAVFPALVAAFSLLGVIGQNDDAARAVMGIIDEAAPEDIASMVRGPIEQLAQARGAGIALISGLLVALWSASSYVRAFSRIMNRIYRIEEGRPFWKLRPLQLLVTLLAILSFAIAAFILVMSGEVLSAVGNAVGASEIVQTTWRIAKWPLLVFVVVFIIAMLYFSAPNVQQPKFRWISPGAIVAIVLIAVGTLGFGIYVTNFSNYDRTYGSLAGVVILLLWVWIANLGMLLGAEFDVELERARQLQGGIAAEEELQLSPRDSRRIVKVKKKDRDLAAEGYRIRTQAESNARRAEE